MAIKMIGEGLNFSRRDFLKYVSVNNAAIIGAGDSIGEVRAGPGRRKDDRPDRAGCFTIIRY